MVQLGGITSRQYQTATRKLLMIKELVKVESYLIMDYAPHYIVYTTRLVVFPIVYFSKCNN